jgi:formamidopyrimidine-DNA glycosylase
MNQEVIAGIGNVYRAEILFRAEIDPHTPGSALTESQIGEIWRDCVELLKVGVQKGTMITRDELRHKKPSRREQNWIYKREGDPCYRCGSIIEIELMAARKLYWCPGCQKPMA